VKFKKTQILLANVYQQEIKTNLQNEHTPATKKIIEDTMRATVIT